MQFGNMHTFASSLAERFSLASVSVLIRKKHESDLNLAILFEPDDARETNSRYIENSIFHYDPFINERISFQKLSDDEKFLFIVGNNFDSRLIENNYKNFMIEENIKSFGASIKQLSSDIDIIIGIHGKSDSYDESKYGTNLFRELSTLHNIAAFDILKEIINKNYNNMSSFFNFESKASILSKREMEIYNLIKMGLRNKEISYKLSITENTVEGNIKRMFKKFNVHNRSSLILNVENSM